ncbi:hypothetical protein FA13DRAFT_1753769 [Coprinellus micaceus]|uniref:Tail specific protease domain-containing protein n=1 Tax=Coprinellus micaceus TaxID=71717 RepID=A0A4Y7TKQ2_COPMI|nr:hypothetical protein FA13DRAFT_1753769 [Coprinellus micaceus]
MVVLQSFVTLALLLASGVQAAPADPCAAIGGKKWVAPSEVRACYQSFKLDNSVKNNIIDVVNRTLAFHTSTNYQIRAPAPFTVDVHVNVPQELARIKRQSYRSEYDFHVDLSRTVKRLNDGHCVWTFGCYVPFFFNYLPIPLAHLTDDRGRQGVYIAPEAFAVASAEFPDQIDVWQNALPFHLKGKLESLNGAKVLLINGLDPYASVNANTLITGSYQGYGTRQNAYAGTTFWATFAQQSLPLADSVLLTIQRKGAVIPDTIVLPYRSRLSTSAKAFTDTASWRANNCVATATTNEEDPSTRFEQAPPIPVEERVRHPINVFLDDTPLTNVDLPPTLKPALPAVKGSRSVSQFYLLDDKKTGVLALGSFSDTVYDEFLRGLLEGLLTLKSEGATQLIVDVSNNGGGYICAAHWLHRIIAGPKSTTEPQAGLDTKARAGPLAQAIVDELNKNPKLDTDLFLNYNPQNWRDASNKPFDAQTNWLRPVVESTINGVPDAFSPRLGQECQPEGFPFLAPTEALFDPTKVVIVSNGRCASSCSLFSITMSKHEGAKTVVVGGKSDIRQQYCGIVGGQSTNFKTIDTEIKTTQLKNNSLAPPDLLVAGSQGITWRLAFGLDKPEEPEEWQDHPADLNLPVTAALVNNPVAIWTEVTKRLLQ